MLYMTKSLSNKLYLMKQLYGLRMNEGTTVLEHLNFFNKVISELLAVDVMIDEEDKTLILLSSLSEIYDHIVTTILYGKKTLILEEIMSTLLSNEIRKKTKSRGADRIGFSGHGKERKRRKERSGSSNAYHFCHREGRWKNDCKHRQELLKKGQAQRQA